MREELHAIPAFQATFLCLGSPFAGDTSTFYTATNVSRINRYTPCAVLSIPSTLKVDADFSTPNVSGSFGDVFFGKLVNDGTGVVLKRSRPSSTARALFNREREINSRLRSIVKSGQGRRWPSYLGTTQNDSKTYLVWRRAGSSRTLEDYLSNSASSALGEALGTPSPYGSRIRIQLFRRVTRELLQAVEYLHSMGIVHRDIKPENVLVVPNEQHKVQLIDFGAALDTRSPLWGWRLIHALDELYAPPERRVNMFSPTSFDIFSVGVIALRCLLPSMSSRELAIFRTRFETMDFDLHRFRTAFQQGRIGCGFADAELRALFNQNDAAANACFNALASMLNKSPGDRARASRALELL